MQFSNCNEKKNVFTICLYFCKRFQLNRTQTTTHRNHVQSQKAQLIIKHCILMALWFSLIFSLECALCSSCLFASFDNSDERKNLVAQINRCYEVLGNFPIKRFLPLYLIQNDSLRLKNGRVNVCRSIIKFLFTTVATTIKGNYDVKIRQTIFDSVS